MPLDVRALVPGMMSAARGVVEDAWPEAREYAASEFEKLAETIELIERLHREGKIDEDRARLHLELQKNSAKMVLIAIEGLGIIAAERAVNEALGVARDAVNGALGFALL